MNKAKSLFLLINFICHIFGSQIYGNKDGKNLSVSSFLALEAEQQIKIDNYNAIGHDRRKWPGGIIPYTMQSNEFDEHEVLLIHQAMRNIESGTCIRFRSSKYSTDYVILRKQYGCSSRVGRQGGAQYLFLDYDCFKIGTIMHELMHVVGFYHMFMHPNRDQYLQVNYQNIYPSFVYQFQRLENQDTRFFTPFDYESIMMYGSTAFSRNGLATLIPKANNVHILDPSKKQSLSYWDRVAINRLYECTF